MKTIYLTTFLLFCHLSEAQISNFGPVIQEACNGDSISTYENWEAYQTLDNTYTGPRDSSICISIGLSSSIASIAMDEIDQSRPVFFRYKGEPLSLQEDQIYFLKLYSDQYDDMVDFGNEEYCYNGLCTGSLIGIEIPAHPDSTELADVRWYSSEFFSSDSIDATYYDFSYSQCVPTEYFENGNFLNELMFQFMFDSLAIGEMFFNINFELPWMHFSIPGDLWQTDQFTYAGIDWYSESLFLVDYPSPEYPSEVQYVEFSPNPNVDTVATVNLMFQEGHHLVFQPYTDLRGGYIMGSDSIRHNLNLINNGGEFCLGAGYIEVSIPGGGSYTHESGTFDFRGVGSCLRFEPESNLIIAQDARLDYGRDGQGTIALYPESNIELHPGATLVFNNRIALLDKPANEIGASLEIDVLPSTKIVFGEHAYIVNWSQDQESKIVCNMLGGEVDLSGLSNRDLQNVVLKYPTVEVPESAIQLLMNPVTEALGFDYFSEVDASITIRILESSGRVVKHDKAVLIKGSNTMGVDLKGLRPGVYFIETLVEGQRHANRFVKL